MTAPEVPRPGSARSYWLQEALAEEPGEPCPPLAGRISADVCIVGGGFAGLWTAWELLRRSPGTSLAILEADVVGGGASGRNGGFLSSSWHDLPGLVGLFGEDEGLAYAQALADEIDGAEAWCAEHRVDAWFRNEGVLFAHTNDVQASEPIEAVAVARGLGVPEAVRPVSVEEARGIADSPEFRGGAFIRDCATVQPARLARGLRRVLLERGVHVVEGTRVRAVEPGPPAIVRAEEGAVRAEHVVLTMGAWAAGWPGFRHRLANIADHMVATEPIPERLEEIGWTSGVGIADGRDLLFYLRTTADGRIAIGGGATGVLFGGHVGRRATHDRRVADVAARGLLRLFPQLEGVRFTHAWGGPIDHTSSYTPFFRTLPPGNLHCGLGFSGHGLAATKLGGRTLASLVMGADDRWARLPVVGDAASRVPPEPFRWLGIRAVTWGMEAGDRRADRGLAPRPWHRALASVPDAVRGRLRAGR